MEPILNPQTPEPKETPVWPPAPLNAPEIKQFESTTLEQAAGELTSRNSSIGRDAIWAFTITVIVITFCWLFENSEQLYQAYLQGNIIRDLVLMGGMYLLYLSVLGALHWGLYAHARGRGVFAFNRQADTVLFGGRPLCAMSQIKRVRISKSGRVYFVSFIRDYTPRYIALMPVDDKSKQMLTSFRHLENAEAYALLVADFIDVPIDTVRARERP